MTSTPRAISPDSGTHWTEPGAWAWHCHVLNHAESEEGMFGMVTAMIVE